MHFVSTRLITTDVQRLGTFYEAVTHVAATRYSEDFAELATPVGKLAIGSTRTSKLFGEAAAVPAANRSAIIEFLVDDVDAVYQRLAEVLAHHVVQVPTTMPWGNRSLLFRDPDGNLVNFFTPVTPEARKRFAPP
jgi:predicted enzyme related to lactoylglutathione lyase